MRHTRSQGQEKPTAPNIMLIITDQERQRRWIPSGLTLPGRQRLIDEGLEFTSYYTHTSPCSPSRASLFTGLYLPQHGVDENVNRPPGPELAPSIPTLGHLLRRAGYYTAYMGKWHLSMTPDPEMEAYGFSDWKGNDWAFMGLAGAGLYSDPIVTEQTVQWLRTKAGSVQRPWFTVVSLVNPHDVMWFPADQKEFHAANPDFVERANAAKPPWKEGHYLGPFPDDYDQVFDTLPLNNADDLFTKPPIQRQWQWENNRGMWGPIDLRDKRSWLRQLDYYWRLHQESDRYVERVLQALDESGFADSTAVVFTSDHGDMCGSHGLRRKGPFVYEEIMRVPLYVRYPGVTSPGTKTEALGTHVDLATTIASIAASEDGEALPGLDLTPVLSDPTAPGRSSILFAQDRSEAALYESCLRLRYAIRSIFDGRHKYARYYGVGFGDTKEKLLNTKIFDVGAPFEEHDHEWYDLREDPHEMVNLAHDPGRRKELRERFHWLLEEEAKEFGDSAIALAGER